MTDQLNQFTNLLCSGHFPPLSNEVLDRIEDFLNYSVNAEIDFHINYLIQYYSENFKYYIHGKLEDTEEDINFQFRLIHSMRYIRPSFLTAEYSTQLEEYLFFYLNCKIPELVRESFIVLVDHFISRKHGNQNRITDLLSFIMNFLDRSVSEICSVDHQLLLNIIYSYRYLLSVANKDFIEATLPRAIDVFVKIIQNALQLKDLPIFFPTLELIVEKSLRLVSLFIEWYKSLPSTSIQTIMQIKTLIPNNVKFVHIYLNFILLSCVIFDLNQQSSFDYSLNSSIKEIFNIVPLSVFPPFNKGRRIIIFFKSMKCFIIRLAKMQTQEFIKILQQTLPIFGHLQGNIIFLKYIFDIYQSCISAELIRNLPNLQLILLEHFILSLELTFDEFCSYDLEKESHSFEIDYWLESNLTLTKLIIIILSSRDISDYLIPHAAISNLFIRLIKYFSAFLDFAGKCGNIHAPEQVYKNFLKQQMNPNVFKKRVNEYISTFIQLLRRLPPNLLNFLITNHLILFLPSKPYQNYHMMFILQFIRSLSESQAAFFSVAYFHCIVENFDLLFMQEQNNALLYTIKSVFQEALDKTDEKSKSDQLCLLFYTFLLLSISTKNRYMIELFINLLQLVRNLKEAKDAKASKLEYFFQIIKQNHFPYYLILRSIAEDPNLEVVVAILALYLFPFLNTQHDPIESWVLLFLPALENDTHRSFACQLILESSITAYIPKLRESTQYRLISALSKEPKCVKMILSKIPDIASKQANNVTFSSEKKITVKYRGVELPFNSLLKNIEKETDPSDQILSAFLSCFISYLSNFSFLESIINQNVSSSCAYIIEHKKELFENAYLYAEPPMKYSLLVLREKYELPVEDYSLCVEKLDDFLSYVCFLCYKPYTVKTALNIIKKTLPKIPNNIIFLKVVISLIHSSIYEHKIVNEIFEKCIFTRTFTQEEEKYAKYMYQYLYLATRLSTKHIRMLAFKALDFFQPRHIEEHRKLLIKELPKLQTNSMYMKYEIIFFRPFDDVLDQQGLVLKLISMLNSINIPHITKEIKRFFKSAYLGEKYLMPLNNGKFFLKAILRILIQFPPGKNTIQIYEQLVSSLKEEKARPLVPFLLKDMKRVVLSSKKTFPPVNAPLSSLFGQSKQAIPPSVEDFQILYAIVRYASPLYPLCVQWLVHSLKSIQQNSTKITAQKLQLCLNYILKTLRRIRKVDQKVEVTSLYASLLEYFIVLRNAFLTKVKEHKFATADPTICLQVITSSIKNKWSLDVILFAIDLLMKKECKMFRHLCFSSILSNFQIIYKYITETQKKDQEFLILKSISTLATIIETFDEDDFDLSQVLKLAKVIFMIYETDFIFAPSFIHIFTKIFFPLKQVKAIERFSFQSYKNEIMILYLRAPKHFYHPYFLTRFLSFAQQLSDEFRENFWTELMSISTENTFSKILINQMLNILIKNFTPTEQIQNAYNTFRCLFENQYEDNMKHINDIEKSAAQNHIQASSFNTSLLLYTLNYTAVIIGLHPKVTLNNLTNASLNSYNSLSHTMYIRYHLLDLGSINTITRFLNVSKRLLAYEEFSGTDFDSYLSRLLSKHPFMFKQSLLCFVYLGKKNFILKTPSRSLLQFIFGLATTTLENISRIPERQFIYYLPLVFNNLYKNGIISVAPRIVDLLVFAIVLVFQRSPDPNLPMQYYHFALDLFVPHTSPQNYNPKLISELQTILDIGIISPLVQQQSSSVETNTTNANNNNQTMPNKKINITPDAQLKIQFIYQIIPPLARHLFTDAKFIPKDLLPSMYFSVNLPKEILPHYQKALRSSYSAGEYEFGEKIIKDSYLTLNKIISQESPNANTNASILSKPIRSFFATVAEWINNIDRNNEKNTEITSQSHSSNYLNAFESEVSSFLHMLLAVFRPINENHIFFDLLSLKQPVHISVLKYIQNIETYTDENSTHDSRQQDNIIIPSYNNNSNEDKERIHDFYVMAIKTYSSLKFLDQDIEFRENDFQYLLNKIFNLDWFSIHESMHKLIFLKLILPSDFTQLIFKMNEKEKDNFIVCISQEFPESFERFFQYYINSFPDSSLSDCFLQTYAFSKALPLFKKSLYQNLCFLERSNNWNDSLGLLQQEFPQLLTATSFHQISNYAAARAHYIQAMSLHKQLYFHALNKLRPVVLNLNFVSTPNMLDIILRQKEETQSPQIYLPIFQDNSTHFEFKSAMLEATPGKYATSFISPNYIPMFFKSSMIEECQQMIYIYIRHQVRMTDLFQLSSITWTSTLDKNNAMASNLAWRIAIIDNFVKHNSTINQDLVPNISKFSDIIKFNHRTAAKLLSRSGSFYYALKELDFAECSNDIMPTPPTSLNRIAHFLSKKPSPNSYLGLRINALIALRDLNNSANLMKKMTSKQTLEFIMTIRHHFKEFIINEYMIQQLFQELPKSEIIDGNIIISIIISLIKNDDKLKTVFSQKIGQLKDDELMLWLSWLPIVFQVCKTLPIDFMMSLLSYNTSYFLLQLHHLKNTRIIQDQNYFFEMNNAMKAKQEVISEFERSLEFIKVCIPDIQHMLSSIKAIKNFYSALIKGRDTFNFNDELNEYKNFQELIEYIDSHPPIFSTSLQQTNYLSLIGFRFPSMNQNIIKVSIESKSPNEAHLIYTTIKGESKTCLLISPIIYKYTTNEYLFSNIIQKMIERRREEFCHIYYPQAFLIHPMLLLVDSTPAVNMLHVCSPYSIPKMLMEYEDASKDSLVSPKEAFNRRKGSIPNNLLFKWFVKGIQGHKNDFIFMRKSFASHFATISYLHSLFGTPQMINPSFLFLEDRQRLWFPGYLEKTITYSSLPLTNQINYLLPEYVLRGSFAASWHTIANVIVSNQDRIRSCLYSIAPHLTDTSQSIKLTERINGFGIVVGEDTDKSDEYFPFLFLDHLIKTSQNCLLVQPTKFGWV